MKKRFTVVAWYGMFCIACFFLQYWIVTQFFLTRVYNPVSVVGQILADSIIVVAGLMTYALTMTIVAWTGFLIAWKRKDSELKAGFKIAGVGALLVTFLLVLEAVVFHV
jgi:hypothetical protein